jgi:hypothetical protein
MLKHSVPTYSAHGLKITWFRSTLGLNVRMQEGHTRMNLNARYSYGLKTHIL